MNRLPLALVAVAAVAGAVAAAAAADQPRIRLTAAGQAAARRALVTRADLGGAAGWKGRSTKPDLTSTLPCPYQPRQSDLVVTGAAETVWQNAALEFDSEAEVMQTPAMVRLDWQRTVLAPQVAPCLKSGLAKQLPASDTLVAFGRISFPRVAAYTRAYRAVIDVKTSSGVAEVMVDVVLVGRRHTEITLTTTAPLAASGTVEPAEERLATLLAGRAA